MSLDFSYSRRQNQPRGLFRRRAAQRPTFLEATRRDTGNGAVEELVVYDEAVGRVITLLEAV